VEVAYVRRDAGHFRQDAPHATQMVDENLQEASASAIRVRASTNKTESECDSVRAKRH
jgi:hypothetical protein